MSLVELGSIDILILNYLIRAQKQKNVKLQCLVSSPWCNHFAPFRCNAAGASSMNCHCALSCLEHLIMLWAQSNQIYYILYHIRIRIILYHNIISYQIRSYHIFLYCIAFRYRILCSIIWYHTILYQIILCYFIMYYFMSYNTLNKNHTYLISYIVRYLLIHAITDECKKGYIIEISRRCTNKGNGQHTAKHTTPTCAWPPGSLQKAWPLGPS